MDSKLELSVNTIRTPEHPFYIVRIVLLINQISFAITYFFMIYQNKKSHDITLQETEAFLG